eukprot:jgi/Picre1/35740/NNA_003200.t1
MRFCSVVDLFGYHFDGTSRRFFEGWYWRVTLPGDAKSFALIYSIEDPKGDGTFSGVGAQVMGPDDGYLLQYSNNVSLFWADSTQLALGACFQGSRRGAQGMLPQDKFTSLVKQGFQASSRWHQGNIIASETGASGDLMSTVDSCRWGIFNRTKIWMGQAIWSTEIHSRLVGSSSNL